MSAKPLGTIAVCLLALVGLGTHAVDAVGGREVGWAACEADLGAHEGTAVILPLHDVGELDLAGGRLWVSQSWRDIPVIAARLPSTLRTGAVVSVVGTCAGPSAHVRADRITLHPLRPWKEGLGVAGLAAWLVSLPFTLRRTRQGWWLRGDRSGGAQWPTS